MKKTILTSASLLAILASSASASLVAGWDFSQFTADGDDDIDFTFAGITALNANYSDLDTDATPGFGGGAAAFGQATWANPSTFSAYNVAGFSSGQGLAGVSDVVGSFDLGPGSIADGQIADSAFGMFNLAGDASVITFALTPGTLYDDWGVQFGGITNSGAGTVTLTTSNDGVTFGGPSTVFNLNAADTLYSFDLSALGADDAVFVNMVFSSNAIIDNLAFTGTTAVPEPSSFAAIIGLMALGFTAVRRRK